MQVHNRKRSVKIEKKNLFSDILFTSKLQLKSSLLSFIQQLFPLHRMTNFILIKVIIDLDGSVKRSERSHESRGAQRLSIKRLIRFLMTSPFTRVHLPQSDKMPIADR